MRTRVLIADDHSVVLQGLQRILNRPEYEVVGAVQDGRALVEKAVELKPDLIIADIGMPLLNGVEAIKQIERRKIRVKILCLSMYPDVAYATEAMRSGAKGYVIKTSGDEELLKAIKKVLAGELYITPSLDEPVRNNLRAPQSNTNGLSPALTERQREVLQLLAEGKQAKEIAALLDVSVRTVEFHKYRVMEILAIRTVAGLAAYAAKNRIVP